MKKKFAIILSTTSAAIILHSASVSAFSVEVGETTLDIYGYARLSVAHNFDKDAGSANEGYFEDVGSSPEDIDGVFQTSASQSRIGFLTQTPTSRGIFETRFEGDFWSYNDENPRLRLRHAYGSWNGILAGQTWSNYNSFVGFTPTLDFYGPAASQGYGSRVPQLRYTIGNLSIAGEAPQSQLASNLDEARPDGDDGIASLPALTIRYEAIDGPFSYSIAGVARQLKYDTGPADDTAMGYAGFLAGAYELGLVKLRGIVHATEGANSYLYDSGSSFNGADAYVTQEGELETLSGTGASIGLSYQMTPKHVFNISYGITDVDGGDEPGVIGNADRTNQNAFINVMWTPVEHIMYGIEYGYFKTDVVNQDETDASRLMLAAQYNF